MTGTLTSLSMAETSAVNPRFDWKRIAYLLLASRGLDDIEENRLMPEKKVVYQFSARGHDLAQPRVGGGGKPRQHLGGDVVFGLVALLAVDFIRHL